MTDFKLAPRPKVLQRKCDNCDAPATHAVSHSDHELGAHYHGYSCDKCLTSWRSQTPTQLELLLLCCWGE